MIEWKGGDRPELRAAAKAALETLEDPVEMKTFGPLPTSESQRRKNMPLFDGCMLYFPDALLAVAEHSRKANEKHNPGEALHWSKHKSNDHPNCAARHMVDMGPNWDQVDPEFGSLHAVAGAWRALATAQIAIEAQRAGMTPRAYLKQLEVKEAA